MARICHRRRLGEGVPGPAIGPLRKHCAALATGPLPKRVVIEFVNTFPAQTEAEPCDLPVFRLRIIHKITWMLTESFTDRGLVFAAEDDLTPTRERWLGSCRARHYPVPR
jgi:hypothetical protein